MCGRPAFGALVFATLAACGGQRSEPPATRSGAVEAYAAAEVPVTVAPAASATPEPYPGGAPCEPGDVDLDTTLAHSASGRVHRPVRVQLLWCPDGGGSYAFETDRQRGAGRLSRFSMPAVLLADLDFDGVADLWATGCPDGQCRVRTSDVWLFDPARSAFVLDSAFSALPNLELAPTTRRLAAGVGNCGCGGACYVRDVYAVEGGRPVRVLRYEQECVGDGEDVRYREYERTGGSLQLTFETDDPAAAFPKREPLGLIDYAEHGTGP